MSAIDPSVLAWVFVPELWFTLAIVLIILDIVVGMDFFVLPIGVSALTVAGLLWAQSHGVFDIFSSWRQIAIFFAVSSVVAVGVVRRVFQTRRAADRDINDY
ncbi:MAG: hypothetical protein VCC68_06360 [Myxococcota bacterium]